jgi:hypothetical protein
VSISITSPGAGAIYTPGSTVDISWTYTGIIYGATLWIEGNSNEGTGWEIDKIIDGATINSGGTQIAIPIDGSDRVGTARIGINVFSWSGPLNSGLSYGAWFQIVGGGSVILDYPEGGESFSQGTVINVEWSTSGDVGPVAKFTLINDIKITDLGQFSTSAKSAQVSLPDDALGDYTLEIECSGTSFVTVSDLSGTFTISKPTIEVVNPIDGSIFNIGDQIPIQWKFSNTNEPFVIDIIDIDGIKININTQQTIISGTGQTVWIVPNNFVPGNYYIEIKSSNPSPTVTGYGEHFVIEGRVKVISPNTNVEWQIGITYKIEWIVDGDIPGEIKVELLDIAYSGAIRNRYEVGTYPSGQMSVDYYVVPSIDLSKDGDGRDPFFKISVTVGEYTGRSDKYFRIVSPLYVIGPFENIWFVGQSYQIRWHKAGISEKVSVSLDRFDGGNVIETIVINGKAPGNSLYFTPRISMEINEFDLFRIRVVEGELSATSGMFLIKGIPDTVRELKAEPGNSIVTLTWKPPLCTGGHLTDNLAYLIYRNDGNIAVVSTTSYEVGAVNGDINEYGVVVHNYPFNSAATSVVIAAGLPTEVKNPSAESQKEGVEVSWASPEHDGGFPVESYCISRGEESNGLQNSILTASIAAVSSIHYETIATVNDTQFLDTNVTEGVTYYYRIAAINSVGVSYSVAEVNMTYRSPTGLFDLSNMLIPIVGGATVLLLLVAGVVVIRRKKKRI